MINKKIRNATVVKYEEVVFKSKLEASFYRILIQAGFSPQYECHTYLLWEGFKPTVPFYTKNKKTKLLKLDTAKLRDITYTPDFTFTYNNMFIIIEAKGKENDTYPLKKKLFRKLLEEYKYDDILFFEVYTQKQLLQAIEIIKSNGISHTNTTEIDL